MADAVAVELLAALPSGVLLDSDVVATYLSDEYLSDEAEWAEFGPPVAVVRCSRSIVEAAAVAAVCTRHGTVLRSHPLITVSRGAVDPGVPLPGMLITVSRGTDLSVLLYGTVIAGWEPGAGSYPVRRSQLSIKAATGGRP